MELQLTKSGAIHSSGGGSSGTASVRMSDPGKQIPSLRTDANTPLELAIVIDGEATWEQIRELILPLDTNRMDKRVAILRGPGGGLIGLPFGPQSKAERAEDYPDWAHVQVEPDGRVTIFPPFDEVAKKDPPEIKIAPKPDCDAGPCIDHEVVLAHIDRFERDSPTGLELGIAAADATAWASLVPLITGRCGHATLSVSIFSGFGESGGISGGELSATGHGFGPDSIEGRVEVDTSALDPELAKVVKRRNGSLRRCYDAHVKSAFMMPNSGSAAASFVIGTDGAARDGSVSPKSFHCNCYDCICPETGDLFPCLGRAIDKWRFGGRDADLSVELILRLKSVPAKRPK